MTVPGAFCFIPRTLPNSFGERKGQPECQALPRHVATSPARRILLEGRRHLYFGDKQKVVAETKPVSIPSSSGLSV